MSASVQKECSPIPGPSGSKKKRMNKPKDIGNYYNYYSKNFLLFFKPKFEFL